MSQIDVSQIDVSQIERKSPADNAQPSSQAQVQVSQIQTQVQAQASQEQAQASQAQVEQALANARALAQAVLAEQESSGKTNIKQLLDTMTGRKTLSLPEGKKRLLLHSCCAPCSGEVMEALMASGIEFSIFFYNPNIHPLREYEIRKQENIRFAEKYGIEFIDWDYNRKDWFARTKGMEWEPERGIRCTECFDMRFEVTAKYAVEHGFDIFTSCLGISRWKNFDQITDCGNRAAAPYEGLDYWDFNWRKGGGSSRMIQISKREGFYQQEYCGCVYSLRDSNAYRERVGREPIKIGVQYYKFNSDTGEIE